MASPVHKTKFAKRVRYYILIAKQIVMKKFVTARITIAMIRLMKAFQK